MPGMARKILRTALGLAAVFIVLSIGYTAFSIRSEGGQVRSFCEAIHPGDAAASLPDLGAAHGVAPRWLKGIFVKESGSWYLVVPVGATMGDCACRITHDGKVVLTAKMSCR
jgi:hypothetical protein